MAQGLRSQITNPVLNLRVCQDQLEILTTLNKMYLDKALAIIWQNVAEKRVVRHCYIRAIDYSAGKVILAPLERGKLFEFTKGQTIYIRGSEKSILFKQEEASIDRKLVVVPIPTEVRMYEKRSCPRIKFGHLSPYTAIVEKRVNQTTQKFKEFNLNVYDVSISGASVLFNQKEQVFFQDNDRIFIHRLGDMSFPKGLEGRIVYTKRIEFMSDGHRISKIKMGIAFYREISQELVDSFKLKLV